MKSKAYILGFLCGLAVVALAAFVATRVLKRKTSLFCNDYDERQKAIQGQGYKYAYFTMMIAAAAGGVVEMMLNIRWLSLFPFAMFCLWLSICVFVSFCVRHDAYVALNARRKPLTLLFLIFGAFNLALSLCELFGGDGLMSDGRLNVSSVSLISGVASLYLSGVLIARDRREKREGAADE